MLVQFDTTDLTPRDAKGIIALLEALAWEDVPNEIKEKEAVRHESAEKPEIITGITVTRHSDGTTSTSAEAGEPVKKRGRPKKDQATEVPAENPTGPTGTSLSETSDGQHSPSAVPVAEEPSQSSSDGPISLDELREVVNDHVAAHGMGSAMAIIKKAGCERVTGVMELNAAGQRKVLEELRKVPATA